VNLQQIVAKLRAERDQIDRAITAIEGLHSTGNRRGRPPGSTNAPKKRGRRRMSAAARKRVSEIQKKRWAAWRQKRKAKAA
jgi:hypothetical protein